MKSPEANGVSIRLEINVPVGVCVGGVGNKQPTFGKQAERLHLNPHPPGNGTDPWPVLPHATNGLGTICGHVTYSYAMTHVWAYVYPEPHYPSSPAPDEHFPRHALSVRGTPSNENTLWTWDDTNSVKWAAHSATGAENMFAIWYQRYDGSDPLNPAVVVYDDANLFMGITDATPCGGSGSDGDMIDPELDCADVIRVVIPDGHNRGEYPAKRTGKRTWEVSIKGRAYSIACTACRKLSIRRGGHAVTSKSVSSPPFLATFDGHHLDSKGDVLVMIV